MRVHLIDGTYELFRAFYGAPSARAPDGREVGGARGLLRGLSRLLRDDGATHAAVAFDTVIESFRNQLFAGYKTGAGIDPELLAQFPLAEEAAAALGLTVWPMSDFEADDALATAAARLETDPRVTQVLLCSPDKDLMQCVRGDRVVLRTRPKGADKASGPAVTLINEDGVRARFGVAPRSIPDLLALCGDSADGIPGIARWGERSAGAVLARYPRFEDIPEDPADWDVKVRGAAALAQALSAARTDAELYRRLATLRTDVPIDASLDALAWRGPRLDLLAPLCERLGDARFLHSLVGPVRGAAPPPPNAR